MEENVIVEESVDTLEPELLASIEKKAKELKEKNPDKKIIFPIVVDGNVEFG